MSIRLFALLLAVPALVLPVLAAAQPEPIGSPAFPFPGSVDNPPTALSAATAQADAWLGDEPYANPAAPPRAGVTLSPSLVRMSRQDLRADNRNYDESPAFFDLSGAAVGLGAWRSVALWLYAHQPLLRLEDNAYTRGTAATDPGVPPGALRNTSSLRELRAGLAASSPFGPVRLGVAVEFTRRDDEYDVVETSGSPDAGLRHVDFSGSGVGGQAGARWENGRWVVGLGVRFLPALTVDGEQSFTLFSGDSLATLEAERESGLEGGLSARFLVSPDFSLIAGLGGRTSQEWSGFDVASGAWTTWRFGLAYHDVEVPWSARFGVGQERQDDMPEPEATMVGLGFGYDFEGVLLDVGAVRRSITRDEGPTFYDDRIVASVRVAF